MEKIIGRYLNPKEVIHHIDGDTLNNIPENLLLFANSSEHIKYHSTLKRLIGALYKNRQNISSS